MADDEVKESGDAGEGGPPLDDDGNPIDQVAHFSIGDFKKQLAGADMMRLILSAACKEGSNFGTCMRSIESGGLGDG